MVVVEVSTTLFATRKMIDNSLGCGPNVYTRLDCYAVCTRHISKPDKFHQLRRMPMKFVRNFWHKVFGIAYHGNLSFATCHLLYFCMVLWAANCRACGDVPQSSSRLVVGQLLSGLQNLRGKLWNSSICGDLWYCSDRRISGVVCSVEYDGDWWWLVGIHCDDWWLFLVICCDGDLDSLNSRRPLLKLHIQWWKPLKC